MTYSLSGISSLGDIQEEQVRKEANMNINPLWFSDSNNTDVLDWGGATRTITITGIISDTPANIVTAIGQLDALVNGWQTSANGYPKNYVSDKYGTKKVKFLDVVTTSIAGFPRRLAYTIRMVESSLNG